MCNCVAPLVIAMLGCGPQNLGLDGHCSLLYTELNSINNISNSNINLKI
jgi:hypothetical protein